MTFMLEKLKVLSRLRPLFEDDGKRRIYARHGVLMVFMVGALLGETRLSHVEHLRGDPLLLKFLRLPRWPVRKVVTQALKSVSDRGVELLSGFITEIGLSYLVNIASVVVDLDSSVVVAFGLQEGAEFGYCGKGRNRRRHHPLVASVAETRTVVLADYRDGSGIDAQETVSFLTRVKSAIAGRLGDATQVTWRADSGFWSNATGDWLLSLGAPFIFAMPLKPSLKLMLKIAKWRGLEDDLDIEVTELKGQALGLDERLTVVAVRRRVLDPKAPPQGKAIEGCTAWRYQALVTSMTGVPEDLWRFYNGRGDCERVFKVAKGALGMSRLVGHSFRANQVAFLLRLLAYNIDSRFQHEAEVRARRADAPVVKLGLIARQRQFYRAAGRLLRPHGRWELRVGMSRHLSHLWNFYAPQLVATG